MPAEIRYQLDSYEPRTDGSGQVVHYITVLARRGGTSDPLVPSGQNFPIIVQAADIMAVLAMPNGTPAEIQAKVEAYYAMLSDALYNPATSAPVKPPTSADAIAWADANFLAEDAVAGVGLFLTAIGQTLPVRVNLDTREIE